MKEGSGDAMEEDEADTQRRERGIRNTKRTPRMKGKRRKAEWRKSKGRTRRGKNKKGRDGEERRLQERSVVTGKLHRKVNS
jgi:hypothetical protein